MNRSHYFQAPRASSLFRRFDVALEAIADANENLAELGDLFVEDEREEWRERRQRARRVKGDVLRQLDRFLV